MAQHDPWFPNQGDAVLVYLHYAYPLVLLAFFLVAFTWHSIATAPKDSSTAASDSQKGPGGRPLPKNAAPSARDQLKKNSTDFSPARKLLFNWLSLFLIVTFVGNAVNVIAHALIKRKQGWWCGQSVAIYIVASCFVYALFLISLIDTHPAPTNVHLVTWVVGLILELVLLGASLAIYTSIHREPQVGPRSRGQWRKHITNWEIIEVTIDFVRIVILVSLVCFYLVFAYLRRSKEIQAARDVTEGPGETTSLLNGQNPENGQLNGRATSDAPYGSTGDAGKDAKAPQTVAKWSRPTTTPSKSWWEYIWGYSLFFPYLWPAKDRRLQVIVVFCFVLVILQRVINVMVPLQVGVITNILSGETKGPSGIPWGAICLFIFYRILQGSTGLLGALRGQLWIPISQYSYQALATASFEHVHSLSLEFHLGKKTGEVISALSKGNSINTFLEQVTFSVVPMLVDLAVAIAYFLIAFDAYYALVVSIITFCYLYLTIRMAQWRTEIRRQMTNFDREQEAVKTDSMFSYETVKYFNAEQYEFTRYRNAVQKYQLAEYKVLFTLNVMNVTQNIVFTLGLLVTCFIAAYQVTTGQQKVGRFVTLLTYMAQLQGPLNFFGTFYRSIQTAMINSERMLELFKEKPTVIDKPNVTSLSDCEGEIVFQDVKFSYDPRKPAVSGLSFRCAPGTTTALVGESGGGKSTVFRLLFRFYNSEEGSIKIDGHEVKDVSIDSLRRHIGVVPQDTVLFNETLMYNLKYANPSVSDEVVYEACRAASIHEKILGFPDGYATKVGERGLRLSGGEKQRVAIARTIIKDPRIILLDEATAALDTETEQHIQTALATLSEGRTMLVIAHRLSTITQADQILVLHAGVVDESGTHEELLAKKGRYASMWRKQIRAQKAAEEAKFMKHRADRLKSEAGIEGDGSESTSHSEDERGTGVQQAAFNAPTGAKPEGHP